MCEKLKERSQSADLHVEKTGNKIKSANYHVVERESDLSEMEENRKFSVSW